MLELKDIKKSYIVGEVKQQVLKGISVSFRKNEFTSILGTSGSGKTTLLNIIGGLDKYDEGDLIIEGVSTKKYGDRQWDSYRNHRVGFIFQSYNLIGHQSVLSNVEMALTLSGVSKFKRRKKAKEALEKVGLKEHIHKRPNQLSGGQMQRVAIARALVNDPEIILADEPTGALDSDTSVQIMDLLKEVAKDKLVIMVTHNPDLAKEYSTRIIELKDGLILNDSNPYTEENTEKKEEKVSKTSMSLFTSLGLSFKNLLTKKGRTFLTAFAGSIGIIGIALILALSNGVRQYVAQVERDSMADYPLAFERESYDLESLLNFEFSGSKDAKKGEDGEIISDDDITTSLEQTTNKLIQKNNLKEFKKFLDSSEEMKKYVSEIQYVYNVDLQIYSEINGDITKVNPNDYDIDKIISGDQEGQSSSNGLISATNNGPENVFTELLSNKEVLEGKYDVLAGKLPEKYDEIVLILNENNSIPDSTLYTLGIKDRNELSEIINKAKAKEDYKTEETKYSYDDIMNLKYKLVLNSDYYKKENGTYIDYSNDKKYLKELVEKGTELKVVGVLRTKDDTSEVKLGYTHELVEYTINNIAKTDIYKDQTNNKSYDVLTNKMFDGITNTYSANCKKLGIANIEDPDTINIYPKDYDSKSKITALIDEYNDKQKEAGNEENVVKYDDMMKTMLSGITRIINMISMVLIGFVAISLVVSSIMIAIITYISVLERTKEIGILRAIGASKKDVTRVFKAETIIEGLFAGCLGIGIALLICIPVNIIVSKMAHIDNIASMPVISAVLLILLSILLNLISGLIPAKIASKKDPVIALRSE